MAFRPFGIQPGRPPCSSSSSSHLHCSDLCGVSGADPWGLPPALPPLLLCHCLATALGLREGACVRTQAVCSGLWGAQGLDKGAGFG